MFYKLGIKQLFNNKRIMVLSILTISIGVGVFFTINITTDTMQGTLNDHFDAMFGNTDYTVYREDGLFYIDQNKTIPRSYMNTIKGIPGVISVTSRSVKPASYYYTDDVTQYWNVIAAIDVENPDEVDLGVGAVVSCMPGIGDPEDLVLEDLLNYTSVQRPIVISEEVQLSKGLEVGDMIRILPLNATEAYATVTELQEVANGTYGTTGTLAELESDIRSNVSRLVQFTIVGIFLDGSEAPEKPIPDNELSFTGFMPHAESLYIRMNDSFQWVFNNNTDGVSYFMVDVDDHFNELSLFDGTIMEGNTTVQILGHDVRETFDAYIDYVISLIRAVLTALTITSWLSCGMLVKTITQMNIDERLREIGILQSVGFKKNQISEMVVSQVLFMSVVGTGIGLVIGYIPPQFFDLDILVQFLSYNKVYTVTVESNVLITPLSVMLTVVTGILLPMIFSLAPLVKRIGIKVTSGSLIKMIGLGSLGVSIAGIFLNFEDIIASFDENLLLSLELLLFAIIGIAMILVSKDQRLKDVILEKIGWSPVEMINPTYMQLKEGKGGKLLKKMDRIESMVNKLNSQKEALEKWVQRS